MQRRPRVSISAGFLVSLLLAAIISPPEVAAAVLAAAALHEAGHLAALRTFGVRAEEIRLGAFGAVIVAAGAARLSYGRELIVTLAGPAVNLICAPLIAVSAAHCSWEEGYLLAGAHLALGLFNLLPVPPLDGGQAVRLAVSYFFGPMVGDMVSAIAGTLCALALTGLGAYWMILRGAGILFFLAALSLLGGVLPQLALAKNAVRV